MSAPLPLQAQDESSVHPRRRLNGWELALWLIGAALLALSAVSAYLVVTQLFATADNGTEAPTAFLRVVAEILYAVLPGVVTGALLCIIVAVSRRAHALDVARRPLPPPQTVILTTQPADATSHSPGVEPHGVAPHGVVHPSATDDDYSRFMRPPATG